MADIVVYLGFLYDVITVWYHKWSQPISWPWKHMVRHHNYHHWSKTNGVIANFMKRQPSWTPSWIWPLKWGQKNLPPSIFEFLVKNWSRINLYLNLDIKTIRKLHLLHSQPHYIKNNANQQLDHPSIIIRSKSHHQFCRKYNGKISIYRAASYISICRRLV